MSDDLRDLIAQAYAIDDEARRDYDAWQRANQRRQSQGLVYKTFETPVIEAKPQAATMDEATARSWNNWLTNYVAEALKVNNEMIANCVSRQFDKNNEMMGDAIVEFTVEYVQKHLKDETVKLREEVGLLRADLTMLRAEMAGTVKKMRGRDVA